jgi:hypothetical protein
MTGIREHDLQALRSRVLDVRKVIQLARMVRDVLISDGKVW